MTQENWSEAWKEFRKTHYEIPSHEKAKGNHKRITCACGWTNDLRVNSGIALGYKIAWQNHFYANYPAFISKSRDIAQDEIVEVANCEKCGAPSECTVEKSWHSAKGKVESYCLNHSKEFEQLPGFKVTRIRKGSSPEASNVSPRDSSSKAREILIKPIPTEITGPESSSEGKKYLKWASYLLLLVATGGLLTWNDQVQSRNTALQTLQSRNEFVQSCFNLRDENLAAKSGPVGSSTRIKAVSLFYEKVVEAPCVVWGDGTVLKNLFYRTNSSSDNWDSLRLAYFYSLQRWNSIENISPQCADGWQSPSIGKQGACSGHGGVVSGFNESKNSGLANFLSSGERIYPPLYILEEAAQ